MSERDAFEHGQAQAVTSNYARDIGDGTAEVTEGWSLIDLLVIQFGKIVAWLINVPATC